MTLLVEIMCKKSEMKRSNRMKERFKRNKVIVQKVKCLMKKSFSKFRNVIAKIYNDSIVATLDYLE